MDKTSNHNSMVNVQELEQVDLTDIARRLKIVKLTEFMEWSGRNTLYSVRLLERRILGDCSGKSIEDVCISIRVQGVSSSIEKLLLCERSSAFAVGRAIRHVSAKAAQAIDGILKYNLRSQSDLFKLVSTERGTNKLVHIPIESTTLFPPVQKGM